MSMNDESSVPCAELSQRLAERVLAPIKAKFVGKDNIVDLMGVCLVSGEHLFLYGPPGTAKSALVRALGQQLHGSVFDYLLTRFTEPNELFGPFDIRKLREGVLVTNTEGMLPEASLVFLDELLNANSAILNSLLMVLNERVFRRGRETRPLPMLMALGASNHLPEDDALRALFDRFLVRVRCDNVAEEQLASVLHAGWRLEGQSGEAQDGMAVDEIRTLQRMVREVDVEAVHATYVELIHRLRHAGIEISDRRAVKFQRLIAASSLVCGRMQAQTSDLWVLRHTWDSEEQEEIIRTLVQQVIDAASTKESGPRHPQSHGESHPDAEALAGDLERIRVQLSAGDVVGEADRRYLRDRLSLLAARGEWVTDSTQRSQLQKLSESLWAQLGRE